MMKMLKKAMTVAVLTLTATVTCLAKEWTMDESLEYVKVGPIYVMKQEVTQGLYEAVMGTNPSRYWGAEQPVESLTIYDVVNFCNKLSEMQGLTPYYTIQNFTGDLDKAYFEDLIKENKKANGWRLPNVTEWEFADSKGFYDRRGFVGELCLDAHLTSDGHKLLNIQGGSSRHVGSNNYKNSKRQSISCDDGIGFRVVRSAK